MAAMLVKNQWDRKPIPSVLADLRESEKIDCTTFPGCPASYTLAYGQTEVRMVNGENNIDIMRRKAKELLKASHPHTRMVDYVWAGPEKGWLDREAATAAGL
jgi:hypothetical protein